jgi:hypothetical protein
MSVLTKTMVIDHMLSCIGESGVGTEASLHPSVLSAKRILATVDLDFQTTGWWFNRERSLNLVPDEQGQVQVPDNTLSMNITDVATFVSPADKQRYTKRGNRIYDTFLHTFNIHTAITVDVVTQLTIEDMPAVAALYVMHAAGLAMYEDDDGDKFKTEQLERRVALAWQKLMAQAMKERATNALDTPFARTLLSGNGAGRNPNLIGGRLR